MHQQLFFKKGQEEQSQGLSQKNTYCQFARPSKIIVKATKASDAHKKHQTKRFSNTLKHDDTWNDDTKTQGLFDPKLKKRYIEQGRDERPVKQIKGACGVSHQRYEPCIPTKDHPCRKSGDQIDYLKQELTKAKHKQVEQKVKFQVKYNTLVDLNKEEDAKRVKCVGQNDWHLDRQKRIPPYFPKDKYVRGNIKPEAANGKHAHFDSRQNQERMLQQAARYRDTIRQTLQETQSIHVNSFHEKACVKMITLHGRNLTELIIDDLLFQLVGILNQFQQSQKKRNHKKRNLQFFEDFKQAVDQFATHNQQVRGRLHNGYKYQKLTIVPLIPLQEVIKKHYIQVERIQLFFDQSRLDSLKTYAQVSRQSKNQVNAKEQDELSQWMVDQLVTDIVRQVEQGSDKIIAQLFKHEFR